MTSLHRAACPSSLSHSACPGYNWEDVFFTPTSLSLVRGEEFSLVS